MLQIQTRVQYLSKNWESSGQKFANSTLKVQILEFSNTSTKCRGKTEMGHKTNKPSFCTHRGVKEQRATPNIRYLANKIQGQSLSKTQNIVLSVNPRPKQHNSK